MAIVQTIDSFNQFYAAIYDNRLDQFSRYAWEKIYDHLNEISEDHDIEFDCIGICCEWSEYDSIEDFLNDYDVAGIEAYENDEEKLKLIEDYLQKHSVVLSCDENCILFADF